MSSQVARLKAQIDAKQTKYTPVHHAQKVRTQAERERIQVETAKKMASRFNLTYRALALSAAKKAAEQRQRDLEAARTAKEAASKYQMTARALKMSSTGTAKGRVNVLNTPAATAPAAAKESSSEPAQSGSHAAPTATFVTLEELSKQPPIAVDHEETEMLRATRPSTSDGREEDDQVGDLVITKRDDDDSSVMIDDSKFDVLSRITEATREQDHEEHDAFWMPGLASALQTGNEDAINVAVVKSFFEEHDPSRMDEAVELLSAHRGREEQLMEALNLQYPAVNDVKDFVEEPTEEALRLEEAARPSSIRGSRPMSTRVTGLTLSVKLGEGLAVPSLEASMSSHGESGFILAGVKQDRRSHKFVVNPAAHEAEQTKVLRERMAQKGYKAEVIEAVIGDTSEML